MQLMCGAHTVLPPSRCLRQRSNYEVCLELDLDVHCLGMDLRLEATASLAQDATLCHGQHPPSHIVNPPVHPLATNWQQSSHRCRRGLARHLVLATWQKWKLMAEVATQKRIEQPSQTQTIAIFNNLNRRTLITKFMIQ